MLAYIAVFGGLARFMEEQRAEAEAISIGVGDFVAHSFSKERTRPVSDLGGF